MISGRRLICTLAILTLFNVLYGQELIENNPDLDLHFQQTVITQGNAAFSAKYSGTNSLKNDQQVETSLTTTLFMGLKLFKGLEAYVNPEISGGSGISGAVGLAGFSNGETFRIGSPKPALYPARMFLKYTLNLGDKYDDTLEDKANQLKGKQSKENFVIILGKFGIADYFDNNDYTHDPRTQFLNWSLMNSGAWDYPADTRGYTWGFTLIYNNPSYAIQFAGVMEPINANGLVMDQNISKVYGLTFEFDKDYLIGGMDGTARLLLFYNRARMGSYSETINTPEYNMDITLSRMYCRSKYGFAFNVSQKLSQDIGGFARVSWNNGKTETWAFTEIDHSIALGTVYGGIIKGRNNDELGLAVVANGISNDHKNYLADGGYGFIIGDGALNYSYEIIFETNYRIQLNKFMSFTPDYQFVINPAYNKDRGPVNIFALRLHTEF